jgi:hypothetical protein
MFDNRTPIVKIGLPGLQKRLDDFRGLGRNHFHLRVGHQRIGYCYIRKNACSSFKKMFLDLAPAEYDRKSDERPIDFMRRHYRMEEKDFARCDHLVFVYRDPITRVMSMFRNKFVAGTGAVDIIRNFETLENRKSDDASFRDFVEGYLQKDFQKLDRHVLPQKLHLRRALYTDVIMIDDLHEHIDRILGTQIADTYFRRPVNRTSDIPLQPVAGASEMPLRQVRKIFAEQGYMPDDESFLPPDIKAQLVSRYAMDYEIIQRMSNAESP